MILTLGTSLGLEACKPCRGSGWNGTCGIYNLLCENCDGSGIVWVERGCILPVV